MIDRKDWREQLRESIAAAASEISRNGADTILAGGRKVMSAEIIISIRRDSSVVVGYDVDVLPEDHGNKPPVF